MENNIRLFQVEDGKVLPTEHCYTISWLRVLMEKYPEHSTKMYAYLWYMSFYGKANPFFNLKEGKVKDMEIIEALQPEFSLDNEDLQYALEKTQLMYTTATSRMHKSFKIMLDNMAEHIEENKITTGREGNMTSFISLGKNYESLRKNFSNASKALEEEQNMGRNRGGKELAYDQQT